MTQQRKPTRKRRAEQGGKRVIKDKFLGQREEAVKAKPKVTPKPKQTKVVPPPEYNPGDVAFNKT